MPRRLPNALWRSTLRVRFLAWGLALATIAAAQPAQARDISTTDAYDLQLFHPAVDSKGYMTLNASQVLGLWDISFGLVGTLAYRPLQALLQDERE